MNVETILAGKGREVATIAPDATVAEALHRMRTGRVGALVVSEDGARIAGIISDRGIMWAIDEHGTDVLGHAHVLARPSPFVNSPNASVH